MRNSISQEKIIKLNKILTKQRDQFDNQHDFQAQHQQQALKNRHLARNNSPQPRQRPKQQAQVYFSDKQISGIQKSRSRLLLASDAKSKIQDITDLMSIDLKPESKVMKTSRVSQFKKYQFKRNNCQSKQLQKSNQLIESKVFNYANQSTQISKQKSKRLIDVNYDIFQKYFSSKISKMTSLSKASEIYQIINPLYQLCGLAIEYPLVKLYRNCIYYGQHSKSKNQIYEGILVFYDKKRLYYGQFLSEKKHGFGVQINFNDNSVYIGRCDKGQKIDDFQVVKPGETYKGIISNWLYQGYGQLRTKCSIYKGYFQKGERHGEGKQYFPQAGLVISGTFIRNSFSNDQQEITKSRFRDMQKSNANINKSRNNPEQRLSQFNYDLCNNFKSQALQKKHSNSNQFRIKRKGHIRRQQIGRKVSISQQDPLINKW